jgi:hypothetical protein
MFHGENLLIHTIVQCTRYSMDNQAGKWWIGFGILTHRSLATHSFGQTVSWLFDCSAELF